VWGYLDETPHRTGKYIGNWNWKKQFIIKPEGKFFPYRQDSYLPVVKLTILLKRVNFLKA